MDQFLNVTKSSAAYKHLSSGVDSFSVTAVLTVEQVYINALCYLYMFDAAGFPCYVHVLVTCIVFVLCLVSVLVLLTFSVHGCLR